MSRENVEFVQNGFSALGRGDFESFVARRGPHQLRHTFATEALEAGISIFELSRVMGASVKTIDKHYGHLARDSEDAIRARLGRAGPT